MALPVWLPLLWGVLVGLVFSTVGAAGGILASVGLISVMGIQDPNLVKPMPGIDSGDTTCCRAGLLPAVPPGVSLAVILGASGILCAIIGSTLSVTYLADPKIFRLVFGVLVLGISLQIIWQLLSQKRQAGTQTGRAAAAFEG